MLKHLTRILAPLAAATAAGVLILGGGAQAEDNMVLTGTFDTGLFDWESAGDVSLEWQASADRFGSPFSGGVEAHIAADGTTATGFYQCVPAEEDINYKTDASIRVPIAGNSPGTYAYIFRVYYDDADCHDSLDSSMSGFTSTSEDGWQDLSWSEFTPAGTESMWIYMVLNKGTSSVEAFGLFDNIWLSAPDNADGDACRDGQELMPDPSYGGDRDPHNAWDFYDVTGDKNIDLSDTLAILGKFGLMEGDDGYESSFDRYAPDTQKPWRSAQAIDGAGIDLTDALVNLDSFGHTCQDVISRQASPSRD